MQIVYYKIFVEGAQFKMHGQRHFHGKADVTRSFSFQAVRVAELGILLLLTMFIKSIYFGRTFVSIFNGMFSDYATFYSTHCLVYILRALFMPSPQQFTP